MNNEIRNILRAFPRIILISNFLMFIITKEYLYLRIFIYILLIDLLIYSLKLASKYLINSDIKYRPYEAGNKKGCGLWISKIDKNNLDDEIGLPSGHSAQIMFFVTFWVLYIIYDQKNYKNDSPEEVDSVITKILRCSIFIFIGLSVILSRTYLVENCHTVLQVILGSIIGISLGIILIYIERFIKDNNIF